MNNLSEWVAIIGLIAAIITILIVVKKIGNVEQAFKDGITNLEAKVEDDRKATKDIADKFEAHFKDRTIHRNSELEQRVNDDFKDFQKEVKAKLERLLEK
jgi:flagellar motility protein MotE (MotC chaperone)